MFILSLVGSHPSLVDNNKKEEEMRLLNDRLQNLSLELTEKNSYIEKLVSSLIYLLKCFLPHLN